MNQDEMSNHYKEPSIDASYQVSVHLAQWFKAILVSDWLISKKKSSFLKQLCLMNRNLIGSILGRLSIKTANLVPIRQ
jgi:hypothetical protein